MTTSPDPSLALPSPRQEVFAQLVANGMKLSDAYMAAGYANSPANASTLARTAVVEARVAWLREFGRPADKRPATFLPPDAGEPPIPPLYNEVVDDTDTLIDMAWVSRELKTTLIAARREENFKEVLGCIELAARMLGALPQIGKPGRPAGTRRGPHDPTPDPQSGRTQKGPSLFDVVGQLADESGAGDAEGDPFDAGPDEGGDAAQ
jgi:hypothetical protein